VRATPGGAEDGLEEIMAAGSAQAAVELDRDTLLGMYETMMQIRTFEDLAGKNFAAGLVPGFVHLYAGEEAVAVGICSQLTDNDFITSTHRGHGHCIAKGVDIAGMVAELMGKSSGVCKGKGGSMHIADIEKGMLGANGIVGGGIPLACGAALTAKTLGTGGVAVCFFGDGAANQGTFHEGLNLAAIWNLPVVFVCENNGYAESTPVRYHCATSDIANRAGAYEIPGVVVDGLDVFAVYEAATEAIARARRGDGPSLLEAKTYRFYGHFQGDQVTYRTADELEIYKQRDPIAALRMAIVDRSIASADELDAIDARVTQQLDDAWVAAKAAPFPEPEEALTDVYVTY
jgi:acetoin:2,6-dichlorophenolindophenol oxidoreductase subunit alpha